MVCLLVTLGISVQLVLMLVLTLALPLIPDLLADYTQVMDSLGSDSLVSSLTLVVGAPLAEEFCFRGVGMRLALRGTRRPWLACVIQALAFGAAHLNLVQGAYAFAIGILLGVVALRTGRLWTCVLLHASVNAASYLPDLLSLIPTSLYAAGLLFAGTLGLAGVAVGVRLLLQASYFESTGEA